MTKGENEILTKIVGLINACPAPSPNPYDLTGYIHACRDYQTICYHATAAISNFASFRYLRTLKWEDFDDYELEICEDKFKEHIKKLEEFVNKRKAENWE